MAPPHAFIPTLLTPFPKTSSPSSNASASTIPSSSPHPTTVTIRPITSFRPLPSPLPVTPSANHHSRPKAVPNKPNRILLWFHNDLRISDNPALRHAARTAATPGGTLLPCIVSPSQRALPAARELAHDLEGRNSHLLHLSCCNCGGECNNVAKVIMQTCERYNLKAVYFNKSNDSRAVKLETRVTSILRDAGIEVESFWGNALFQPDEKHLQFAKGSKKDDKMKAATFTGLHREVTRRERECTTLEETPDNLPRPPAASMSSREKMTGRHGGGSSQALRLLASRMDKMRETVALSKQADLAVMLKDHLDFGSVSVRMVAVRVLAIMGALKGRTLSELVWRTYEGFASHAAMGVGASAGRKAVAA